MKNVICSMIFFIVMSSYAQVDNTFRISDNDSTIVFSLHNAYDCVKAGYDLDSCIAILTEVIETDSSFFEVFYSRGIFYDIKYRTGNDSLTYLNNAIRDYEKCMSLKLDSSSSVLSDTSLTQFILGINTHPSGIMGDPKLLGCYAMLRGVSAFMRTNGTDRTTFCKEWQFALDNETSEVKLFIDKYCE